MFTPEAGALQGLVCLSTGRRGGESLFLLRRKSDASSENLKSIEKSLKLFIDRYHAVSNNTLSYGKPGIRNGLRRLNRSELELIQSSVKMDLVGMEHVQSFFCRQ